jgi:Ca2+-binding RTX toxin-like protein
MATFDMSKSASGVNLQGHLSYLSGQTPGSINAQSATGYDKIINLPTYQTILHFGGTGFLFPSLYDRPSAGTVQTISYSETILSATGSVSMSINIMGLSLSVGLLAASTYQNISNELSRETIFLGGNDTLIGSSYNDILYAGRGNNTINGGAGSDTINYSDKLIYDPVTKTVSGITVDLNVGVVALQDVDFVGGAPVVVSRTDTLVSVENVIGSGDVDVLRGTAGANTLWGLNGNDTLDGRAGDDILNGGYGDDALIGGLGNDTADYSSDVLDGFLHQFQPDTVATGLQGAVVDLIASQSWGAFGHDTLTSIENVNGSAGDDWISGTATANTLSGNLGADTIYGLGGDDIILGGAGNDRIESGAGVDYVEGGLGNDTLIDNSGTTNPHEWSALHGGAGNDIIEGRGRGDVGMWGDEGNDTLTFGAGNSFAYGGSGADVFQFGSDALSLAGAGKSFAQIYDYELGVDHIHVMGGITVLNWGVNTGINVVSASGAHEVIMLMGITSAQLDATSWLI